MIILSTVWNLFDSTAQELNVSRNGASIMVYNICDYIGQREKSYVFVGNRAVTNTKYNHVEVLDNNRYLPENRRDIEMWQKGLSVRFGEILEEYKPNYVLIHTGGTFSLNCIKICIERKQKFSFVNHLYFGQNNFRYNDEESLRWEEEVFGNYDIPIVTVGLSMKEGILRDYPNLNDVVSISNGTSYHGEIVENNFRKKYNIEEKKVLICSGSFQPRKNQIQLINAFKLLPNNIKEKIVILFCGKDSERIPTKDNFIKEISANGFDKSLIYIGTYSSEDMKKVYSIADGLVMPSLSEGLSLVALEMLTYGKPVIMFSDNETAGDVNNPNVAVLAKDHLDQTLADAIVEWFNRDWDEGYIKSYSEYFCMERVADEYIEYCRQRSNE